MKWGTRTLVSIGLLVGGLVLAGVAGPVGAADDGRDAVVHVTGDGRIAYTMQPGENLHQVVDLTEVDDGVGRFGFTLSVTNGSVATLDDVRPGPDVEAFSVDVGPANETAVVRGRYTGSVTDWGSISELVDVSLRGHVPGETRLEVPEVEIRDEAGNQYDVKARTGPLTVTDGPVAFIAPGEERGVHRIAGEDTLTVHALAATDDVGALRLNLSTDDPESLDIARFVDATVADDPDSAAVHVDGRGRFVRINASGLDLEGPGSVPLVRVTVRGLSEGSFLLQYDDVRLLDTEGRRYVIDHHDLGNIEITDASDSPAPTPSTEPPTTGTPATTSSPTEAATMETAATTSPNSEPGETTTDGSRTATHDPRTEPTDPTVHTTPTTDGRGPVTGTTSTTGSGSTGFTALTALAGVLAITLLARRR